MIMSLSCVMSSKMFWIKHNERQFFKQKSQKSQKSAHFCIFLHIFPHCLHIFFRNFPHVPTFLHISITFSHIFRYSPHFPTFLHIFAHFCTFLHIFSHCIFFKFTEIRIFSHIFPHFCTFLHIGNAYFPTFSHIFSHFFTFLQIGNEPI